MLQGLVHSQDPIQTVQVIHLFSFATEMQVNKSKVTWG